MFETMARASSQSERSPANELNPENGPSASFDFAQDAAANEAHGKPLKRFGFGFCPLINTRLKSGVNEKKTRNRNRFNGFPLIAN